MSRTALVANLLVAALAAAWGALVLLDRLVQREEVTTRALVLAPDGRLVLDAAAGEVVVRATSGKPRLTLKGDRGLFGAAGLEVKRMGDGRLEVVTSCPAISLGLSCGGSLEVLVPAGSSVDLDTGSGSIDVRRIRGGVVAETGSGSVRLEDVGGPVVRADTGSGQIDGVGVAATRLEVETGSGSIDLAATGPLDDVSAQTGSGDIDLVVPDEVYDVNTETGSGDLDVTVRADTASPRRLRARTGSGALTVRPAR